MPVKNLMEDIVINIVEDVLSGNRDLQKENVQKEDIIAYILNRIPPKYITSERGILHGKLEARYVIQQKTDILLLLYEAINVINRRRATEIVEESADSPLQIFRFAHIFGEVLEESTLSVIPDVVVTLLFNGKPARMVDADWKNPYRTNRATMGFYHFWPDYIESEMGKGPIIKFTLNVQHVKFEETNIPVEMKLLDRADMGKSHVMPLALLRAKKGVDLDFLEG